MQILVGGERQSHAAEKQQHPQLGVSSAGSGIRSGIGSYAAKLKKARLSGQGTDPSEAGIIYLAVVMMTDRLNNPSLSLLICWLAVANVEHVVPACQ